MTNKPSKLVKEAIKDCEIDIINENGLKGIDISKLLNLVEKRAKEEEQKDIFEIAENGKKLGYNSNNALGLIEYIQRVLMKRRLKIIKEKA